MSLIPAGHGRHRPGSDVGTLVPPGEPTQSQSPAIHLTVSTRVHVQHAQASGTPEFPAAMHHGSCSSPVKTRFPTALHVGNCRRRVAYWGRYAPKREAVPFESLLPPPHKFRGTLTIPNTSSQSRNGLSAFCCSNCRLGTGQGLQSHRNWLSSSLRHSEAPSRGAACASRRLLGSGLPPPPCTGVFLSLADAAEVARLRPIGPNQVSGAEWARWAGGDESRGVGDGRGPRGGRPP
jgi:hypothetical protein